MSKELSKIIGVFGDQYGTLTFREITRDDLVITTHPNDPCFRITNITGEQYCVPRIQVKEVEHLCQKGEFFIDALVVDTQDIRDAQIQEFGIIWPITDKSATHKWEQSAVLLGICEKQKGL